MLWLISFLKCLKQMEKAMAPHSSTLAWKIPWMKEPGRLQSMGSRRDGHDLSDFTFNFHFYDLEKKMATHSSVLAWRIPGMGSHRVGHDWSDLVAVAIKQMPLLMKDVCLEFYFLKFKIFNLYINSIHLRGISWPFPSQLTVGAQDGSCVVPHDALIPILLRL